MQTLLRCALYVSNEDAEKAIKVVMKDIKESLKPDPLQKLRHKALDILVGICYNPTDEQKNTKREDDKLPETVRS